MSLAHGVTPINRLIVGLNVGSPVRIYGSLIDGRSFWFFRGFMVHVGGGYCLHLSSFPLTGWFHGTVTGSWHLGERYELLLRDEMTWSFGDLWYSRIALRVR